MLPRLSSSGPAAPDSAQNLMELAAACSQCQCCDLAKSRQQVVMGRGNPAARLLLIGEAPGAEEDVQGQPFVGRAGRLLEQLLAEAGLDSGRDLYIANAIKCRPPANRKPSRAELAACRPWLEQQIALQRPQLIGLLGATALEAVLGLRGGITKLRGQWLQAEGHQSPDNPVQATQQEQKAPQKGPQKNHQPGDSVPIHWPGIALMPLLHPSYLLRYPSEFAGSPRWHTRADLLVMRRRLDGLAAR